jgi:hypothetical protein
LFYLGVADRTVAEVAMRSGSIALALSLALACSRLYAATCYVWTNSPVNGPGTAWTNAFRNIQGAIDAAASNDTVLVTNGIYATGGRVVHGAMTNRIALTKPILVRSVNGAAVTVIRGAYHPGTTNGGSAVRCAYVTNGAVLVGFTLTNGATCTSGDVFREMSGGGVWCEPGGILSNCTLTGNSAYVLGAGAYHGTFNTCTLVANKAGGDGGGAYDGTLNNCMLRANSSGDMGGGSYEGTLNNCTLAGNSAFYYGGGSYYGTLNNCIVYFNTAPNGTNWTAGTLRYCCTTPWPGGADNRTNAPMFVSTNNLRLAAGSPCIEAGSNVYVQGTTDCDGRPRVVGTRVDMGAYEYQGPGMSAFIGWLDEHHLPTDGSAEQGDPDGDGMATDGEYAADTDPINSASVLGITGIRTAGQGVRVDWKGGVLATQYLECVVSLMNTGLQWTAIFTNLPPTPLNTNVTAAATTNQMLFRIRAKK